MPNKETANDSEKYDCAGCDRPNSAENMVQCGSCKDWYHLSCAQVSPGVKKRPWNCVKCPPVKSTAPKCSTRMNTRSTAKAESATSSHQPLAPIPEYAEVVSIGAIPKVASVTGLEAAVDNDLEGAIGSLLFPEPEMLKAASREQQPCTSKRVIMYSPAGSSTSSSRAKTLLALQKLEEERKLDEAILEEERKAVEMERALAEKENAIKLKAFQAKQKFIEEKYALQEQLTDDEAGSAASESNFTSLAQAWLNAQRQLNAPGSTEQPQDPLPINEPAQNENALNQNPINDPAQIDDPANRDSLDATLDTSVSQCDLPEENNTVPNSTGPTVAQLAARKYWPKKLPTFTGEVDDWPVFYSSYLEGNKACGFTNAENIMRLREAVQFPARSSVALKLTFPHAVPEIMETLRRLYGEPQVLVKRLLQKVEKLEAPNTRRPKSFVDFGLAVQQICDTVVAANLKSHLANPSLMDSLVEKLPFDLQMKWVKHKMHVPNPTLKELGDFMYEVAMCANQLASLAPPARKEAPKSVQKAHVHTHDEQPKEEGSQSTRPLQKEQAPRKPCPVCGKVNHRVRNCEKLKQMSVEERLKTVEQLHLCKICLFDHGRWKCRSRYHCTVGDCKEQHHPLLHRETSTVVVRANCHAHQTAKRVMLFRVLPITLYNGDRRINTFAFFDEGSSLSMVETSVARALGAKGVSEPLELSWTGHVKRKEESSMRLSLQVSARGGDQLFDLPAVHTVESLGLPRQNLKFCDLAAAYKHLEDLPLLPYDNEEPRVLIGLPNIALFAPLESRIGQPDEPIAVKSLLGWAVYGPCKMKGESHYFMGVHGCQCKVDQELNEMIRQQFVLDDTGISASPLPESADIRRAREILEHTTTRCGVRFITGLLWRCDDIWFPESLPMAISRMKSLESKLAKNPELRENVYQQIREYIENGYAHKATAQELASADPKRVWYLPLNVVGHPKKPDKKRLVWDAAAQVDGVSLNSQLLKGPDLLVMLPSVICKFRQRCIGFGGDIEKMFHQIRILPEDTHSQRFLFRFDTSQAPDHYIMDVATFGATCSPCSALHVMHRNADEQAAEFPEAARAIKERTYMDDYFDSTNTPEEAIERARQVKLIHARGGFNMRSWVSNCAAVVRSLGEEPIPMPQTLPFSCSQEMKRGTVLGVAWDPNKDIFVFSTNWNEDLAPYVLDSKRPSKRIALRVIMSLFDPLGLLAPYLVHGRMLIQDLWRAGGVWDKLIEDDEFKRWQRWIGLLPGIERLEIPRSYFGDIPICAYETLQLHIFTDASEKGYGCAAYFRIVTNGGVRCILVMAKAKVAPLKYVSIPRLELQAALLGARMMKTVCDNHTLKIAEKFIWTDSDTVLSWIKSDHRKFKQFVAFRIGEILSLVEPEIFHHVPTKDNVADCLTKWNKDTEPNVDGRWFRGPSFLYQPEESWPQRKKIETTTEELRVHVLLHRIAIPQSLLDARNISKWKILLRAVAFVFRFIFNCRQRIKKLPIKSISATKNQALLIRRTMEARAEEISQDEYERAEHVLFRIAQSDSYPDEMKLLMNNRGKPLKEWKFVEKVSPIYKLSPFADEFGIIRMEGRTENAKFASFDARFPIILPKDHPITVRLLEFYHSEYGHGNKETVVNELRQRFNIKDLRSTVEKAMFNCQWCKVHKCKPRAPRMAPLPEQRLTPNIRPFSYVGVDYLGPLEVTVGRHKEKRYVSVFTCMVTRAIHLELAYSLTTESCIMAFRRFIRRRGSPVEIFSDNGTNFVGASRELARQIANINNECAMTFTDAATKWTFNPPSAPHMGGVWERMVRSTKEAMRAFEDGGKLTDEILITVLSDAEGLINSRPLTYMPDGGDEAITPNHFLLQGSSGAHIPLIPPVDLGAALRSSYQRSLHLTDVAWERWKKEYFPTLNKRSKWFEEIKPLEKGDLVYVAEGQRRSWVRGIVEKVIIGKDGRVRQALVRTTDGVLKRPVTRLAILEVTDGASSRDPTGSHLDPRGGVCSGTTDAVGVPARSDPIDNTHSA